MTKWEGVRRKMKDKVLDAQYVIFCTLVGFMFGFVFGVIVHYMGWFK